MLGGAIFRTRKLLAHRIYQLLALIVRLSAVSLLIEEVEDRKAIRRSTGYGNKWFERPTRPASSERRARNAQDEPLLFASEKTCGTEIAHDLKHGLDHRSSNRDKVYLHLDDARSKCSVRSN